MCSIRDSNGEHFYLWAQWTAMNKFQSICKIAKVDLLSFLLALWLRSPRLRESLTNFRSGTWKCDIDKFLVDLIFMDSGVINLNDLILLLFFRLQYLVCRYRRIHSHLIDIFRPGSCQNVEWTFCSIWSTCRGKFKPFFYFELNQIDKSIRLTFSQRLWTIINKDHCFSQSVWMNIFSFLIIYLIEWKKRSKTNELNTHFRNTINFG